MKHDMDEIRREIENVVRERFEPITIVRVEVEEGQDHDDEPAFFVRIVFDAEVSDLPAERLSGLKRHLRTRLASLDEFRFPYTRFTPRADLDGAAA